MHVIRSKERQLALGEMQRRFGITHLAPGLGIKIVKKNRLELDVKYNRWYWQKMKNTLLD